ncbi:MAG: SUEL-type lectin domain-containing protein [Alphaproteobacteria bacterium]|nr:SUEL-type lectin domain-containing protein [Alphaproteobacteria bacterium]
MSKLLRLVLFITGSMAVLSSASNAGTTRGATWELDEPKTLIAVVTAGYRSTTDPTLFIDAGNTVRHYCNGRARCSLNVTNDVFGADPHPFTTKYLWLRYQCLSPESVGPIQDYLPLRAYIGGRSLSAKEGDLLDINCGSVLSPDSPVTSDYSDLQKPWHPSDPWTSANPSANSPNADFATRYGNKSLQFQGGEECKSIWGVKERFHAFENNEIKVEYIKNHSLAFSDCILELYIVVTNKTEFDFRMNVTGCSWNGEKLEGGGLWRAKAGPKRSSHMSHSLKNVHTGGKYFCEWEYNLIRPKPKKNEAVSTNQSRPQPASKDALCGCHIGKKINRQFSEYRPIFVTVDRADHNASTTYVQRGSMKQRTDPRGTCWLQGKGHDLGIHPTC